MWVEGAEMSAWPEIVNSDGSDEWLETCYSALADVQRESNHRAAERIRAQTAAEYQHVLVAYGRAYANGWKFGRDRAADLVEGGA